MDKKAIRDSMGTPAPKPWVSTYTPKQQTSFNIIDCQINIGPVKQNISALNCDYFLTDQFYMCFGCSKELSHLEGSFEYTQRMFWLRNKKNNFQLHTLIWGIN